MVPLFNEAPDLNIHRRWVCDVVAGPQITSMCKTPIKKLKCRTRSVSQWNKKYQCFEITLIWLLITVWKILKFYFPSDIDIILQMDLA